MSQCKDCGAPVIWAKSKNGKSMLLDAEPLEPGKGKFVLYGDTAQYAPVVECPKRGHKFVGRP